MHSFTEILRAPVGSLRGFLRRGSAAIETVVSLVLLLSCFAIIAAIVQSVYQSDELSRVADAIANAVATSAHIDPCDAARRELHEPPEFECDRVWTTSVVRGALPSSILDPVPAFHPDGDLVVVTLTRPHSRFALTWFIGRGSETDPPPILARAIARIEPGT